MFFSCALMRCCAHSWISAAEMPPEPSRSIAAPLMQSRQACVATPPAAAMSSETSLSRAAAMYT